MLGWILLVICTPFIFIILPTKIVGKKYLKEAKKEASIYSCNHQSNNDAIVLKSRVNWKLNFMAKDSLFKNKLVGGVVKSIGAYPIKRGGNDIEAVKHTLKLLKEKKSIVIFPEGTRVKNNEAMEYKNGLVFFALRTDCLVVPMVFRKKPMPFRFNKLVVGKPFRFSEMEEFQGVKKPDKDVLNRASEILTEKMEYLKNVEIKAYKNEIKNKGGQAK